MSSISRDTLVTPRWHGFQTKGNRLSNRQRWRVAQFLVPLLVAALLLTAKMFVMAAVVAGMAALIWLLRAVSPVARRWVDYAIGVFMHWVGQVAATLLLAPAFFLVMPLIRFVNRFTDNDPLQLRSRDAPTFWLPSDVETRRGRYMGTMFCTERLMRQRFTLLPLVILGVVLLVGAELGLRLYGIGPPLLFVQDADVGYYPKPHQRVRYPGRIITINNYGMRAPDITYHKPPGHTRILLLGDSTLAGTYVSNEELYSSLLENRLNATAGAPVFEVLNMGVNAWGPFHELGFVKKFGTFDADVAVICGPLANCYRPLYGLEATPFWPETHPPRFAIERVLFEFAYRFRAVRLGPRPLAAGDPATQARLGIETYVELARVLQQQGAQVFVEMLPGPAEALGLKTEPETHQLMAKLAHRMDELGVPMNCAIGAFHGFHSPAELYHDSVHFNRLGHRLYAEYLAERLCNTSSRVQEALKAP